MAENCGEMKPKRRRRSMQLKLNALVIGNILAVAVGLILISYYVFCQRVDDEYYVRLSHAAEANAGNVIADELRFFWNMVNTDEFRELRDRAEAEDNDEIILDWMKRLPGWYEVQISAGEDIEGLDFLDDDGYWSLYDDYEQLIACLTAVEDFLEVDSAYYQIDIDGETYNIVDPNERVTYIGTAEKPIKEFEQYEDNASIPPTVYRSEFGWLCTAMEPIVDPETGEILGIAGADINMTDIVQERAEFLKQSLLFVLLLLVVAIISSVALVQRTAVRPLRQLADAATRFAKEEDRAFTKDDVIQLDIRTNDEVSDLYQEIQSMENRIVNYTEHLTIVTAEKERVSTELRTASQIQESMLPSIFPAFPEREDFDLYASMTPAKEVGGDFYDFFLIDETHLAVLIADVSDKGVPAALFMMSSKILFNYRAQLGGTPSEILSAVNAQICTNNKSKMFVTVWLGILDLSTGILTCSNAGHEYPVIRGEDGVFRVFRDKHGLVVGARAKSRYQDYEIQMKPGDAVFVYTDGIPEANNEAGDFYGMERLEKALNRLSDRDPQGILEGIKADVDAFTGDARQFDDLTMLCVEYKGK